LLLTNNPYNHGKEGNYQENPGTQTQKGSS
jgi:hypothetical protein